MSPPQSLLAELRALESRRAQGALSAAEEARLAELRSIAGPQPAPRGFDVNAAAAAIRESLVPAGVRRASAPPAPDLGAPGPRTLTPEAENLPPEALAPAAEPDLAPPPGIEVGAPPGYDVAPPSPPLPEGLEVNQASDVVPSFDAGAEPPAEAAGLAEPAPPAEPAGPLEDFTDAAESGGWSAASPAESPPQAAPEIDTASWDLSRAGSHPPAPPPAPVDPGATAVWSLPGEPAPEAAAAPAAPHLPEGWAEAVEPAILDELQLESDGSFAFLDGGAAAQAAAAPPGLAPEWIPPMSLDLEQAPPAPEEVSDDQILEVGAELTEVTPDDIPTLEAVELAEEEEQPADAAGLAAEAPTYAGPAAEAQPPEEAAAFSPEAPPAAAPTEPPPVAVAPEPPPPPVAIPPEPPPPPVAPPPALHLHVQPAPLPPLPLGPVPGEPVPLESLAIEEAPLVEEAPAPPRPSRTLRGVHRVVVHTVEGQVKRGSVSDPDLSARELVLAPQPSGAPEALPAERVRAIFFMLGAGETPPAPEGARVRVTFKDGRQVAGFSPDYDPDATGFFMIPADTRTNTARIWVYRSAVRQVSVS